jgi:uncharacterized protein YndB with AHSA1/START domain
MQNEQVITERVYNAPTERVWQAITDIEQMKQWYFDTLTEFEPEVGFEARFENRHNGAILSNTFKVIEVVPGKKLSHTWTIADNPGNSVVTWELFDEGDKTKLVLTHDHVETFRSENTQGFARQDYVNGWSHFAGKLQQFVENQNA